MTLIEKRRAIHHLLDRESPADAQAVYYAFHHDDRKTQLVTIPEGASRASGYVCLARTGMDLFRPLVTLRLPRGAGSGPVDPEASLALIGNAISESMPVILSAPVAYRPIISALFLIKREEAVKTLVLDRGRFQPIINVLVARSDSPEGLPRYIARQGTRHRAEQHRDILASAGVNWKSPRYAEIYVRTETPHQRQGLGRSVVASLVQHLLDSGQRPLYRVASHNRASIRLAESVGFVDIGIDGLLIEADRRPSPQV